MNEDRKVREEFADYEHFPTIRGTGPKKLPDIPNTSEAPRRQPKPAEDTAEAQEES